MPQVSIIIPTYKHRDYILSTLDSVFAQTFNDYEIIVVNDSSPDDTAALLRPLVESGRIRYFEQPHRGPSAARNRGIAEARGEFIALLDDDDLWPAEKLEWQVEVLQRHPNVVLVYGYMETMGEEPRYRFPGIDAPSGRVQSAFFKRNWIRSLGQVLVRAEALRTVRGFDEGLWGTDDWDLYIRLAACGEFLYCSRRALYYRAHVGNASKDFTRMYLNACRVQHKHLGRFPRPDNLHLWLACRRSIQTFCMNEFITSVRREMKTGNWIQVEKLCLQALRIKPTLVVKKIFLTLALRLYGYVRLFVRKETTGQEPLLHWLHWRVPGVFHSLLQATDRSSTPNVEVTDLDANTLRSRIQEGGRIRPASGYLSERRAINDVLAEPRPKHIQIQGPFEDSYSLAIVNRNLARALSRKAGVEVTLFTTYVPQPAHLVDKPDVELLCCNSTKCEPADYVIRNIYPPYTLDLDPRQHNFLYFAWEDSLISAEWADDFNRGLDGIMVSSRYVRSVLCKSGVAIPIEVIPNAVEPYFAVGTDIEPIDLGTRKSFRFLHISSAVPRKGCDVLLRAYAAEFSSDDDVCLVIKTLPQYDNTVAKQIRQIRRWSRRCPEIIHLDLDLSAELMRRLYRSVSCLVHPARAEGFGLPVAEAMLARLPVIVTNYSGVTEFCTEETALLVGYKLVSSRSQHNTAGAEWAEPDEMDLRSHMRAVYENRSSPDLRKKVERAFVNVKENFTWDRAADQALSFIQTIEEQERRPIRAAMVTTWNSKCGIAVYSKCLLTAMPADNIQWSILAPQGEAVITPDTPNVTRCWLYPGHDSLSGIPVEVERQGIDLIHFQFTFSIFDLDEFAYTVSELKRRGRRVFITFHAIKDTDRYGQPLFIGQIVSSLRGVDRILVHTDEDRHQLVSWGLQENVTHFPHGFWTYENRDKEEIRCELGIQASPVLANFGFLRPHKGILEAIEALSILKQRYPHILLLVISSLYPNPQSQEYYACCLGKISSLGLNQSCKIITDFLTPDEIMIALQASDLIVMPYYQTADSVSGAVRLPIASHRPVIVTQERIFNDVAQEVYQIKDPTPYAIARGVTKLLTDPSLAQKLVTRAERKVARDSWRNVARMYSRIIRAAYF